MRRSATRSRGDVFPVALLMVGATIISIMLLLLVRVSRGYLGVALATLAGALMVYWLMEVRKTLRRERALAPMRQRRWSYDVFDEEQVIRVVAEVPGPAEQVKVSLADQILEIMSGSGFRRKLRLPRAVEVLDTTYNNGVLQVKLRKDTGAQVRS